MISATEIGKRTGLDTKEVYWKLVELGLLTGGPNAWQLTEEGRKYGEMRFRQTGRGRACVTGYDYIVWDESVTYLVGDPDAWRKYVNENRLAAGFSPVTW